MKRFYLAVTAALALSLTACGGMQKDDYYRVPAGYVGKVLTPNGWQKGVIEAGQVNLGGTDMDNRSNSLVLLEASGTQVKEQFMEKDPKDAQDHRIITSGGPGASQMSVATDVYIRLRVPADEALRNRVYAEITAGVDKDNSRISWITVQGIYNRFVQQESRSIIRRIIGGYADDLDIQKHRVEIETQIKAALFERMQELGVPLELQSVTLSNVMPDKSVMDSRNRNNSASAEVQAIDSIGAAIARNPRYIDLQQVQAMERVCTESGKAGHPCTMIVGIDGAGHAYAARSIP